MGFVHLCFVMLPCKVPQFEMTNVYSLFFSLYFFNAKLKIPLLKVEIPNETSTRWFVVFVGETIHALGLQPPRDAQACWPR